MGFGDIATTFIFTTVIMVSSLGILFVSTSIINQQIGMAGPKVDEFNSASSVKFEIDSINFDSSKNPNIFQLSLVNSGSEHIRLNDLRFFISDFTVESFKVNHHIDFPAKRDDLWSPGEVIKLQFFGSVGKGTRDVRVMYPSGFYVSRSFFFDTTTVLQGVPFEPANLNCEVSLSMPEEGVFDETFEVSINYDYFFEDTESDVFLNVTYNDELVCDDEFSDNEGVFVCDFTLEETGPFIVEAGLFEENKDYACISKQIGRSINS